jgi:hypothetical protein
VSPPKLPDRVVRAAVSACVAVIVAAIGVWAQNASLVGVNYDDGIYALLARSLADGDGYRLTHLPVSIPGVKYPPIYSLSLAPLWALIGSQEAALHGMKLLNGIYIGVAAGLFTFLLSDLRILRLPIAAAAALVGFAAGSMMLVSTGLLSEPLYLVLLFLTLWWTDRLCGRATALQAVTAGALAGLVVLTRMVGIALLAAVLLAVWQRCGRRRMLTAAAAAAVLIVPWLAFSFLTASQVPEFLRANYGSYAQLYIANVASSALAPLEIVIANVGASLQTIGAKLLPIDSAPLESLTGAALLVLALLGSRAIFATAPATATYAWFYLAVTAVWSFPPFRFVFILFPLLLALAAVGVLQLAERATHLSGEGDAASPGLRDWRRLAVIAVGALVVVHLAYREARSVHNRVWDYAQLRKSTVGAEVIDWVKRRTDPHAVIAYEFDALIALHTRRSAVPNNVESVHVWYRRRATPVGSLARLLREMGVDYLAVRGDIPAAAEPVDALLGRYPASLKLLAVTPGGALIFETALGALTDEEGRSSDAAMPPGIPAEEPRD